MQEFISNIIHLFDNVRDYRGKVVEYPIGEVLFLFSVGIMGGCVDFEDIVEFCKLRLNDLREYMPFHNGIPHPRTIARIISNISAEALSSILGRFFSDVAANSGHITLDGKHIGGGIFSVSAFETNEGLTIAQSAPFSQGHELSGIKEIITSLNLKGCAVTIDAIGCNKEVFDLIKKSKGEAVIAIKSNAKYLYKQVKNLFENNIENTEEDSLMHKAVSLDKGHGRVEERAARVLHDLSALPETRLWPHMRSIVEITSKRYIKGKESTERRYYASTKALTAEECLHLIRSHWSIENNLHWILDVNLKEDDNKHLIKNARYNIATIKRIVMNLLKPLKPDKLSLRAFHRRIARDPQTMHTVIKQSFLTFP